MFLNETEDKESDVNLSEGHIEILNAFSKIIGQSFFVIDFYRREFKYISPNPLFLCGHSVEEALEMGYSFFRKVVLEEDLELVIEAEKKGYEFFSRFSAKEKMDASVVFDYRLKQPGGSTVLVSQNNTPILLMEDKVRFGLCIINLSTVGKPGRMVVVQDGVSQNYKYSFKTKRWKTVSSVQLSKRETEILLLAAQGFSNESIANTLFIDISTVKFHKRNIFSKLNAKNIIEAIGNAYDYKLI